MPVRRALQRRRAPVSFTRTEAARPLPGGLRSAGLLVLPARIRFRLQDLSQASCIELIRDPPAAGGALDQWVRMW
jgi:hypothetical protein